MDCGSWDHWLGISRTRDLGGVEGEADNGSGQSLFPSVSKGDFSDPSPVGPQREAAFQIDNRHYGYGGTLQVSEVHCTG